MQGMKECVSGQWSMSRISIEVVAVVALFILFTMPLSATTYYVSLSGNDSWPGTSPDSAWRHIVYASTVVGAGDSVLVDNGTYTDEHAVFVSSGAAGNPIVLTAHVDSFVMDGLDSTGIAIRMTDKSYISLSNFHIRNYGTGIRGNGLLQNLEISDFAIENIDGIGLMFDNDASVQNSIITDFAIRNTNSIAISHFDYSTTDCHDVEISHFLIRDINHEGINWRNSKRVHIHHGEIYNTASDGIHLQLSVDSSIVEYVRIDTTGWHGIAIHDHTVGDYPCYENIIRNCYVANAGHNNIDLHSGTFNTVVEACTLDGTPATGQGIYFHNLGDGLLAKDNVIRNMHRGIWCGPIEGHYIRNAVFINNTIYNDERYCGCWKPANAELSNISFINNTFINCSSQSGYYNLMLMYADTVLAEGNSFVDPVHPDEPQLYLRGLSEARVLNLTDNFTRIQILDSDGTLEFLKGKGFTENGGNVPFWYPDSSVYLLNLNETIEVQTYRMNLSPSIDSVELRILQWDTSGTYYKQWQEICENPSVVTAHTVGDFPGFACMRVDTNSGFHGVYWADSAGWISFDYDGGFTQDTITFEAYTWTGINEQSSSIVLSLNSLQVTPNPFRDKTDITFSIGQMAESTELKIYDVSGRIIRSFNLASPASLREAGRACLLLPASAVSWDGTDGFGKQLPAGVYFVQFRSEGFNQTQKVILLH